MILAKACVRYILLLAIQASSATPACCLASFPAAQDKPDVSELTHKCIEFEKQFFGLSFEQTITFKSSRVKTQKSFWAVSKDGNVARKIIEFESQATDSKGKYYQRINLRSTENDFDFGLTSAKFRNQIGLASQMTVDFLVDGFFGNAQQAFSLAPDSMDVERYIGESDSIVESDLRYSKGKFALVCKHPRLPNKRFIFDAGLRLVFVEFESESSNLFGNGFKNRPPVTLDAKMQGAKGRGVIGPIEYLEFGDRWLVSRFKDNTTVGKQTSEREVRFTNYKYLDDDLGDLIKFEGITLPTNAAERRVSSQGEPTIRYEVKDGKIVKVLDSDALAAASAARQRGSAYGSTTWYALLGVILLFALGVFTWARGKSG